MRLSQVITRSNLLRNQRRFWTRAFGQPLRVTTCLPSVASSGGDGTTTTTTTHSNTNVTLLPPRHWFSAASEKDKKHNQKIKKKEAEEMEYGDNVEDSPYTYEECMKRNEPQLLIGTEHMAIVIRVAPNGALLKIEGTNTKGKMHKSEIRDQYVWDATSILQVNDRVPVKIFGETPRGTLKLSMKRVKPKIRDDFQPVTVSVYQVPCELEEKPAEEFFSQWGNVLEVTFSYNIYDSTMTRVSCRVTYETREQAEKCYKECKRLKLQIGRETSYWKLKVRMNMEEGWFRKRMQTRLDKWWENKERKWAMTPEEWRIERAAQRSLQNLIPSYNPDEFE